MLHRSNMSAPTAFVRNFLSACRPWLIDSRLAFCTDKGLLLTNYLGSIFAFNDSYQNLSHGFKDNRKYRNALSITDKLFFASTAPGPEFLIVRHSIHQKIRDSKQNIFKGILQSILGCCFLVLTVSMWFETKLREIFFALVVVMCVLPFFLYMFWKDHLKAIDAPKQWQNLILCMNDLHEEVNPVVSLLTRAFYVGFGDQTSMHEILQVFAPNHISAFASSNFDLTVAIEQELQYVRDLLQSIATETTTGNREYIHNVQARTLNLVVKTEHEAYMPLVHFVLNFIAWYGYVVMISIYFFPSSSTGKVGLLSSSTSCCARSCIMTYLKFGLCDGKASLWLKFIADIAWFSDGVISLNLLGLLTASTISTAAGTNSTISSAAGTNSTNSDSRMYESIDKTSSTKEANVESSLKIPSQSPDVGTTSLRGRRKGARSE